MFLFTTPAPSNAAASSAPTPVIDAIRQGAEQTGTSFEYLLNTARRESSLDPAAKAPTSSATGLFQFIEQTWLGLVKTEGPKLGLSDLSDAISARGEGRYAVSDPGLKDTILKLREDPKLASLMAGALTQQNRATLSAATGRDPNPGELYMAHLLGPRGAVDLIRAANDNPGRAVAADMPEAAAANRSIFFDRGGRPRAASELYAALGGTGNGSTREARPAPAPATRTGLTANSGPALHGLFRTEGRTGPISDAVAKLWRVNNSQGAVKHAALSYFPRVNEASAEIAADAAAASAASSTLVSVQEVPAPLSFAPLPPPRPKAEALADTPQQPRSNTKRSAIRL